MRHMRTQVSIALLWALRTRQHTTLLRPMFAVAVFLQRTARPHCRPDTTFTAGSWTFPVYPRKSTTSCHRFDTFPS
jgi:hypothetical protein